MLALARNPSAPLDRTQMRYLMRRAREEEELGRLLLQRGEPADLAPLFMLATANYAPRSCWRPGATTSGRTTGGRG